MSGHSKWSKVKHQKAIKDPKKSKLFSHLSKQIMVAAKAGGPDPEMNASLRKAIEDAKAGNLPKDKIQNAINKGAGIGQEESLESFILEGYGPGGVAMMLSVETDNRNRTVAEVRRILKEHDGSLGEPGSAAFVFGDDPGNPQYRTPLMDKKTVNQFQSLMDELNMHEDVVGVVHNLDNSKKTIKDISH